MATDTDVQKLSILGKESIHCGFHLVPYIVHTLLSTLPTSTFALITDWNVSHLHLRAFRDEFATQLEKSGSSSRFVDLAIAPGETSKSRDGKAHVEDWLLSNKCTRDTVILALGGGVIGDLVGFVAATFMRGLRFVQIPTTLLAMVDSSIGGKTAIDTLHGKNLIGAFWQPEYIFIDAAFLETLPVREFSNGMAEVVKTAAIWNESEFIKLEDRSSELFAAIQTSSKDQAGRSKSTRSVAQEFLLSVIVGSVHVKSYIVTKDERETGLRNIVNFGHTIGHAIEAVLTPSMLHGECISVGMVLEAEVSRQLGILSQVAVGRLSRCLQAYNLPVSLLDPKIASLPAAKLMDIDRLLDIMVVDKKNSGQQKKIVLLQRIGKTFEEKATVVKDAVIANTLAKAVKVIPGVPAKNPVRMSTPGSKSISNRALVLAALGKGTCRLKNLLHSDDTKVMIAALNNLKGAKFVWEDGGDTLVVEGGLGSLTVPPEGKELYLGNAGTAARFLATVCTLASATPEGPQRTVITGNARMKQRPTGPLVAALQSNGCKIDFLELSNCLPLAIAPQRLKGGHMQLAATLSSQFVSSILLCAPYAGKPVTLELTGGRVISQPYIDMTIAIMKSFGVEVSRRTDPGTGKPLDIYDIPLAIYTNPGEYWIESDASSATYPLGIAAITGTSCTIENIGSSSLQGDAKFAKEVLEKMGCEVVQTPTETTVRGCPKGSLKAIEQIDMEETTDAFLTATVLAAVANGRTRILGIANQRVKECNRIRAMIEQLAKFGVKTVELPDGLEIIGKPIENFNTGISVHCYDDHRVAMAFSVLATVVGETVVEEKRCVEKTWPNWWDDLENKIGIKVEGVELNEITPDPSVGAHTHKAGASIILVGMRGTGKTFIGNMASAALSWPCFDADIYFEEKYKIGVREFVHQRGWSAFRDAEFVATKELIEAKPKGHVISVGGGIVETTVAREFLKEYASTKGPVVRIVRPLPDIIAYLDTEGTRAAYEEPVPDVFRRRDPWFAECSNYLFDNQFGDDSDMRSTFREVLRFFGHISGQNPNFSENLMDGKRSYFLSLTYPDVSHAADQIDDLTEGVDALELRVDLLKSPKDYESLQYSIPPLSYVQEQVTKLRRLSSLPIVFTVRTKSQGGAFPDTAHAEALKLLNLGLQLGVEYVDVELTLPEKNIQLLTKRKGHSKIIASWHDWTGRMKWVGVEVREKYELAVKLGDIAKIVGKAESLKDNFALYNFVDSVTQSPDAKPIIAINMGVEGQMSRILNSTFSPVSHPLLPNHAAPGQLSFREIQQALHLLGLLPSRRFYLFGTPISHALSPTLHNTAFNLLALPHKYERFETQTVGEEIKIAITSPDFGGASVTIPFKIDIIPLLDKLTPAAEAIGAVNTIIPTSQGSGRILVGDNTDWIGIRTCIAAKLGDRPIGAALIIGSGGTARAAIYALQSLHADVIYIYNRTVSKAHDLSQMFPEAKIRVLTQLGSWPEAKPRVIVSTVPASALDGGVISFTKSLFEYRDGPAVVVDVVYRPSETALLGLAKKFGENWSVVTGREILLEQGFEQFRLWTGRRCPRSRVAEKIWE